MEERSRDLETPKGPNGRDPGQIAAQASSAQTAAAPASAAPPPASPLKAAIRRARIEDAERSDVLAELRGAEIARLEMLEDAIEPVLADVPADADLFDIGLAQGAKPRLFIDMIGFVEMGRDRRLYRFVQDTRHGRVILAESERIEAMVKAVTDYIARRLVEREKALASDAGEPTAAPIPGPAPVSRAVARESKPAEKPRRTSRQDFFTLLGFMVDLLGSILLFALLGAGCYYLLTLFAAWAPTQHP